MQKTQDLKPQKLAAAETIRYAAQIALLAVAYFAAGKLGLRLAFVNPNATPVWAPTGISLAALLLFGYRMWPGVLLGAFFVNLTTAGTLATSLSIAAGNTLEALAGAYLVTRFAGGRAAFEKTVNVLKFALLAGGLSTAIGATIAVTSLVLAGLASRGAAPETWLTWWLGDGAGAVVVAPLLLLWAQPWKASWTRKRSIETVALLLCIVVTGYLLLDNGLPGQMANYPLKYLCFPFLLWVAIRLGQHEASTAVLLLSGIAIYGVMRDFGPFHMPTRNQSFLLLQYFMCTSSVTALAVGAAILERKRAKEELQDALDKLEVRVAERTRALRESEQSLHELSGKLLQVQDEERRRIARELHDSMGQKLSALAMSLALPMRESDALTERGRRALAESVTLADQAVREIRTLSYLLHPPLLDELGLGAAMRWYVEGFAKRSGIAVKLEVAGHLRRAPEDAELALFRVMQEALTNVHRYSGSPRARVRLAVGAACFELEVQDYGRGVPAEILRSKGTQQLGVGLRGMRERVAQLQGEMEILSDGQGTLIRVSLPVPQKQSRAAAAGGAA